MSRAALLILWVSLAGACLEDYDVKDMVYPCRSADDCVDGFECHPTRYVCVEAGTSSSAVSRDAGLADN